MKNILLKEDHLKAKRDNDNVWEYNGQQWEFVGYEILSKENGWITKCKIKLREIPNPSSGGFFDAGSGKAPPVAAEPVEREIVLPDESEEAKSFLEWVKST